MSSTKPRRRQVALWLGVITVAGLGCNPTATPQRDVSTPSANSVGTTSSGIATNSTRAPGSAEPSNPAATSQDTPHSGAPETNPTAPEAANPTAADGENTVAPASEASPKDPGEAEGPPAGTAPGWLGVALEAMPPGKPGVLVKDVTRGSPAEKAGLRAGDVLLQVNGNAVNNWRGVTHEISRTGAGNRALLVLDRGQQKKLIAVVLSAAPNHEDLVQLHLGGRPAPRFTGLDPVRGNLDPTPAALHGKVVIVDFWAGWCMPCRAVVPLLNDWYARHRAEGLEIVSVTTDSVVTAAGDAQTQGMTYPVFSDPDATTTRAYLASALPSVYLVDRKGVLRYALVGVSEERVLAFEKHLVELLHER